MNGINEVVILFDFIYLSLLCLSMSLYAVITSLIVWSFAEKSSKKYGSCSEPCLLFTTAPYSICYTSMTSWYRMNQTLFISDFGTSCQLNTGVTIAAATGLSTGALSLNNRWRQPWICSLVQCEKLQGMQFVRLCVKQCVSQLICLFEFSNKQHYLSVCVGPSWPSLCKTLVIGSFLHPTRYD